MVEYIAVRNQIQPSQVFEQLLGIERAIKNHPSRQILGQSSVLGEKRHKRKGKTQHNPLDHQDLDLCHHGMQLTANRPSHFTICKKCSRPILAQVLTGSSEASLVKVIRILSLFMWFKSIFRRTPFKYISLIISLFFGVDITRWQQSGFSILCSQRKVDILAKLNKRSRESWCLTVKY